MPTTRKRRCSKCAAMATWMYLPGGRRRNFFCDNCVPRGCACNVLNIEEDDATVVDEHVVWWEKADYERNMYCPQVLRWLASDKRTEDSFYFEELDEKGRRQPCCEYIFDPDGFEFEERQYIINRRILEDIFNGASLRAFNDKFVNEFYEIIEQYPTGVDIDVQKLMPQIRRVFEKYSRPYMATMEKAYNFYNSFRDQVKNRKYGKKEED